MRWESIGIKHFIASPRIKKMPLLSDAKSCFFGTTPVKKIYAGPDLVWPKEVYAPNENVLNRFKFDNDFLSVPPYKTGSLTRPEEYDYSPAWEFSDSGKENQCLQYSTDGRNLQKYKSENADSTSDYRLIKFCEMYVWLGMSAGVVLDKPDSSAAFVLSMLTGNALRANIYASLNLHPLENGTLQIWRTANSSRECAPSLGWQESSYIPYTSPRWIHVSISLEFIPITPGDTEGRLLSYSSIDGKVLQKELCITGFTDSFGISLEEIIYNVRLSPDRLNPSHPELIAVDELRTASEPLYTEDFNPA